MLLNDKMSKAIERQNKILNYMKEEIREKGYPPTVREICLALNIKSTSTVHGYLKKLEKHGHIEKRDNSARSIILKNEGER